MNQASAASQPYGLRSISDDDLCSDCGHCQYAPGEMSGCAKSWPGQFAERGPREGYCVECPNFLKIAKQGDNWVPQHA